VSSSASGAPRVVLHVWHVPRARVPAALARMGTERLRLRRMARADDGPLFAKLLGTARPTTFTPRATDPEHWALLTTWPDDDAAHRFDDSAVVGSWGAIADTTLRLSLTPLASHGRWAGREPFGRPTPSRHDGPVAALTRARIRPGRVVEFWRQSADVARSLADHPGLVLATGIGEAPVGLQGTFSVWRTSAAMHDFAQRDPRHLAAVRRAPAESWYAEELFARFSVDAATGSFVGQDIGAMLAGPQ
jgi:hypothetical protein